MPTRFFANLLLLMATFLLILGVGEGIARFTTHPPMQVMNRFGAGPEKGQNVSLEGSPPDSLFQYTPEGGIRLTPNAHILIKNHYLSHRDIEMRINSLGFRSPELPDSPEPDERRLLVVGDSITMGDYVAEEETYPARIEFHLKKNHRPVRVINAGIGSADIQNEYQVLLDPGLKTEPDAVLVGLYLNDGELSANLIVRPLPGMLRGSYFLNYLHRKAKIAAYRWQNREKLAGADREWLKKFIQGRNLAAKDWKKDRDGFDDLIVKNVRDWGAAWDPQTWEAIREKIVRMQELARSHRFQLVVVLFPVRHQVEAEYLYDLPQQHFSSLMKERSIPHLDLLPVLRKAWQKNTGTVLYYDKCHLTPAGNEIVAKEITEKFQEVFLKTSRRR